MVQHRDGSRFAFESSKAIGIAGKLSRQDLDGDPPIQIKVERLPNFSHGSGADGSDDLIRPEASTGTEGHGLAGRCRDCNGSLTSDFAIPRRINQRYSSGIGTDERHWAERREAQAKVK